jgi:hypothetical protein
MLVLSADCRLLRCLRKVRSLRARIFLQRILIEKAAFPQYAISNTGRFLYVRNRIVMCWNMNPQKEVTLDEAGKSIDRPECMNADLVTGIWFFLSRRGIINHGVFKKVGNDHEKHTNVKGKTVCVIGGGISGLACAMHLKYLGFTGDWLDKVRRSTLL